MPIKAKSLVASLRYNYPSPEGLQGPIMTHIDRISNFPAAGIRASSAIGAYNITELDGPTITYVGSEFIEIAGKRFSSKQLAYLLSKLLDEHPECQIWEVSYFIEYLLASYITIMYRHQLSNTCKNTTA